MELRRLRLLLELSRRGTLAAVADTLAYSPSSISVQLAELEREVGVKLLRRVGRNVQLTPAGWRLAEYAEQALAADEAILTELAGLGGTPRGQVRVTFVQTSALALLPHALATLAEQAPDLRIEVFQRETRPALEELRSRAVDLVLGIDYDPAPVARHRDVDRVDLIRERVLMAVPAQDPLAASGDPISLASVEHAVWAAGHTGTGHAAAVETLCNGIGGYAPDIRHRTDDALILRALVSSGQVVTLLPALIATATERVAVRPVAGAEVQRTIFTAVRATAAGLPAIVLVRAALRAAAHAAVAGRDDVTVIPERPAPPG
jgi:DNA-binding transcriptional LysR family regulator